MTDENIFLINPPFCLYHFDDNFFNSVYTPEIRLNNHLISDNIIISHQDIITQLKKNDY